MVGPRRIFAFVTCEPNGVVVPIHPRATPVVLSPAEAHAWLAETLVLQKPLADDELVLLERE